MHDHGGGYERDLDDLPESNLLGTTIRNALLLLGAGLLIAWAMSSFDGFGPGAAQVETGTTRPPLSEVGEAREEAGIEQPAQRVVLGGREAVIPPAHGGHFLVTVAVNGVDLRFLVDTGASTVTLTEEDARRAGLRPHALDYNARFQTANGEIRAAPVVLREMRIGDLVVGDVAATVTRAPLQISLLGMTFLSRLAGYEVRNNNLALRP